MTRFALIVGIVLGTLAPACSKAESTEVVTLAVEGMTCGGCESSVRSQLEKVPGVVRVDGVDHETKRAVVVVEQGADVAALCDALKAKGEFTATVAH